MVDPISNEDRARTIRWVKVAILLLVGLSGGLIAMQGGASIGTVIAAVVGGGFLGIVLVWYLFPDVNAVAPASSRRYRE